MSDEPPDVWDLTLRIQCLSLRLRGSSSRGLGAQAEVGAQPQAEVGASPGVAEPSAEVPLRSGAFRPPAEVVSRPGSPSSASVAGSFSVVSEPAPATTAPRTPPRVASAPVCQSTPRPAQV